MSAANPQSSNTGEQPQFKPSDAVDLERRDFRPQVDEPMSPPCLGAVLEYTAKCYRGMEEHGLEVVSIDPRSGKARAGLHGQTPAWASQVESGAPSSDLWSSWSCRFCSALAPWERAGIWC